MSLFSSDEYPLHYDERLHQAYLKAEYVCNNFVLRIGQRHPEFDGWLAEQAFRSYAFLTAHNPHSTVLPTAENERRQQDLIALLRLSKLPFAPAAGRDPTQAWPTETGVFLFDVPCGEVHQIAHLFGQNAVVEGQVNGVPLLVWV